MWTDYKRIYIKIQAEIRAEQAELRAMQNQQLYDAATADIPSLCTQLISAGAEMNWTKLRMRRSTPLIAACNSSNAVVPAVACLLHQNVAC